MKVYYEYEIHTTYAAELEINDDLIEAIEYATGLKVTEEQIKDIVNKELYDRTLRDVDILHAIHDYMCDEVGFDVVDSYDINDAWGVEEN